MKCYVAVLRVIVNDFPVPRNFGSVESLLQKPATVLLARSVQRVVNVSGVRYL